MTQRQEIEFIIHPGGTVEERVTGVVGAECEAVTDAIEKELGQVTRREHTGDFYRQSDQVGDTIPARS